MIATISIPWFNFELGMGFFGKTTNFSFKIVVVGNLSNPW